MNVSHSFIHRWLDQFWLTCCFATPSLSKNAGGSLQPCSKSFHHWEPRDVGQWFWLYTLGPEEVSTCLVGSILYLSSLGHHANGTLQQLLTGGPTIDEGGLHRMFWGSAMPPLRLVLLVPCQSQFEDFFQSPRSRFGLPDCLQSHGPMKPWMPGIVVSQSREPFINTWHSVFFSLNETIKNSNKPSILGVPYDLRSSRNESGIVYFVQWITLVQTLQRQCGRRCAAHSIRRHFDSHGFSPRNHRARMSRWELSVPSFGNGTSNNLDAFWSESQAVSSKIGDGLSLTGSYDPYGYSFSVMNPVTTNDESCYHQLSTTINHVFNHFQPLST